MFASTHRPAALRPHLRKPPQLRASFTPDRPEDGYYNDLRPHVRSFGPGGLEAAADAVRRLTADRVSANPVTIVQFGLGAWQESQMAPGWLPVVAAVADWVEETMDDRGRLAYLFPMRHTYRLSPPWYSALAQGEAASFLIRASTTLDRPRLLESATRAIQPLLDQGQLSAQTVDGPVLQEYPTSPPAHVLNGWIFALWGLYDVARGVTRSADARAAFDSGVEALVRRLPRYHFASGWSRYDLYPHPVPNVASPFYHRLHIELLAALDELVPHAVFADTIQAWQEGAESWTRRAAGIGAKVAFRIVVPRSSAFARRRRRTGI